MTVLDMIRPVFLDGERLSAHRLNAAFEFLRSSLRRVLAGPIGPGVARGLELSRDGSGENLLLTPGLAIDGRGRLLLRSSFETFEPNQILDESGGVEGSIGVYLEMASGVSPVDPCVGHDREVHEVAQVRFERETTAFLAQLYPATECAPAWGDLDTPSPVGSCAVKLGSVVVRHGTIESVRMGGQRQGLAPRLDGIRNSLDRLLADFRHSPSDAPWFRFLVPAGGVDVQSTHLSRNIRDTVVARARESFVELVGGSPDRAIAPEHAGALAMAIPFEGNPVGVVAGNVLELLEGPANGKVAVQAASGAPSARIIGMAAGAPYVVTDAAGDETQVVPLALHGLFHVELDASANAGTPLAYAGAARRLRVATSGDLVIAHLARQRSMIEPTGNPEPYAFVVHPPYPLP